MDREKETDYVTHAQQLLYERDMKSGMYKEINKVKDKIDKVDEKTDNINLKLTEVATELGIRREEQQTKEASKKQILGIGGTIAAIVLVVLKMIAPYVQSVVDFFAK